MSQRNDRNLRNFNRKFVSFPLLDFSGIGGLRFRFKRKKTPSLFVNEFWYFSFGEKIIRDCLRLGGVLGSCRSRQLRRLRLIGIWLIDREFDIRIDGESIIKTWKIVFRILCIWIVHRRFDKIWKDFPNFFWYCMHRGKICRYWKINNRKKSMKTYFCILNIFYARYCRI